MPDVLGDSFIPHAVTWSQNIPQQNRGIVCAYGVLGGHPTHADHCAIRATRTYRRTRRIVIMYPHGIGLPRARILTLSEHPISERLYAYQ